MKKYNIILMHGPVVHTDYLESDTVRFTLEDGTHYDITFYITDDSRFESGIAYMRDIVCEDGQTFTDSSDFDIFCEGRTLEDFAQWTADNWCEIDDLIEYYNR